MNLGEKIGAYTSKKGNPHSEEEYEYDEKMAFEELADAIGIPKDKREDAMEALVAFVEACIDKQKSGVVIALGK